MRGIRFVVWALVALLPACTGPQTEGQAPPAGPAGGRLRIVATTGMVADLVGRVSGDAAEVKALMGPGVDPHLYKATASDVTTLQRADVVFYNGLNLEGKMGELFESLEKTGRPVVPVGERIERARILFPKQFQGHPDPHVWFDVELWSQASAAVVHVLSEVDPARAGQYRGRGAELRQELADLHGWCQEQGRLVPQDRRVLVTSHDAFNYFGRAYGFEVVGLQGISTVTEAGMNDMTALIDFVKKRGIPAVFVESSVPRAALERVSQDSGARIGGELFSDAMGAKGSEEGTYPGMIRHNMGTVVRALK